MDASSDIEQRLIDLEIKASFMEDLLDSLNQVVVRQQQHIDLLMSEVGQLRRERQEGTRRPLGPADELPPHY